MSVNELAYLSAYLQWAGSLLIVLVCLKYFKLLTNELKAIGIYGLASFFFQLLQFIGYFFFKGKSTNIVANIYLPIELLTLLSVYYFAFNRQMLKKALFVFSVFYLIFYRSQYISQLETLNSTAEAIRDFTIITCSILYFFILIRDLPEGNITSLPMFWINAAALFFFSCTFMLSLSVTYIAEVLREDFAIFWAVRNFLRVIFCLLICFGIWQIRTTHKSKFPLNQL
ncbi:hypothetical protein SanaruYs_13640 [Chryseotalea sanaruensis]|uniref:Uncharacterized protein n=1 Tax=Chryseotalea sanaruensis TaxID=2482724 RepID=A0A401U8D7_9BACT|nr:hypothetical protein [Chryseotalea sanaruensis]GCC51144.1 hypothetical protein SanaruYs_13640 [Chryseotalea sanaruensis]